MPLVLLTAVLLGVELSAATSTLSPSELFARVSPGVGFVVAGRTFGSVVAVSETRVVTNWHVVEHAPMSLFVVHLSERDSTAVLVGFDEQRDLAVLQLLHGSARVVPPRRKDLPLVGERVFSIGAPKGLENTLSEGLVSSMRTLPGLQLIQTSAAISHGSSGGGLFDERGNLVAITAAMVEDGQQLNFAVPAPAVDELLTHLLSQRLVADHIATLSEEDRHALVASASVEEMNRLTALLERPVAYKHNPLSGPKEQPKEMATDEDSAALRLLKEEARWRSVVSRGNEEGRHLNASHEGWRASEGSRMLGVGQFRWGMGPGDVVAIVPLSSGLSAFRWEVFGPETTVLSGESGALRVRMSADAIEEDARLNSPPEEFEVFFQFSNSELSGVALTKRCQWHPSNEPTPFNMGTPPSAREVRDWEKWLRAKKAQFDGKYGGGRCVKWADSEKCTWEKALSAHIELTTNRRDADGEALERSASFAFSDPLRSPLPLEASAMQQHASPASWSKNGWGAFRWGMGVGDVEDKLRPKTGEYRSAREMTCHQEKGGSVECLLEREFHAFRLLRLAPELRFRFVDGRLDSVTIEITDELKRNNLPRALDTVRAMLEEKYGAPASESRDSRLWVWDTRQLEITLNLTQSPDRLVLRYLATHLALEPDVESKKL